MILETNYNFIFKLFLSLVQLLRTKPAGLENKLKKSKAFFEKVNIVEKLVNDMP